jgi:hypothetical protein
VHLFEVVPALRQLRGGRRIRSPDVARNPPRGAMIEYYLAQEPAGEVMLTITDAGGEIIQRFSSEAKEHPATAAGVRGQVGGIEGTAKLPRGGGQDPKPSTSAGMSRFLWDMRYPGTQMPPSAGALNGFIGVDYSPPKPPIAPPGRYMVRLSVEGQTHEQPFEILKDPKVKASDVDLRAQFDLMVDIRDRYSEVADTVIRIREVRAQLDGRRAELPEDSRVRADGILEQLRQIEGILTIWMGSKAHPMMWEPPGLTEKLSSLSGAVISGDARPTESMYTIFEEVSERFEVQRNRLNQVIEKEVEPLLSL